jgi:hypothetical protein
MTRRRIQVVVEGFCPISSLADVKALKTVVAMVLLVSWMPATSLCLIERSGWLSNDDCCPSSSGNTPASQPSGDTACCALASATYKGDDNRPVSPVPPSPVCLPLLALMDFAVALDGPPSLSFSAPPPDLPVTWQFSLRAAAPPRAPSVVS